MLPANVKPSFVQLFSILELLVVVLVILLLISLTLPIFVNLKMKSRTSLCSNQLRQIGVLFISYASDHKGYLPNETASGYTKWGIRFPGDIPTPSSGNNELYAYWNGHLIPYLDVSLPDKYTRIAAVTKVGTTRYSAAQWGGPPNGAPKDIVKNGWVVVNDAYLKGGYDNFKVFICSEIHSNTFDVAAALRHNDIRIPRISQLCNGGVNSDGAFRDIKGYDYGLTGGIPTTYLANNTYFGLNSNFSTVNTNSYRIDQITNIAGKIYLVEGGVADPFGIGSIGAIAPPYYFTKNYYLDSDGSLMAQFDKNRPSKHKLSFVHDNHEEFWIRNDLGHFWFELTDDAKTELVQRFNHQFKNRAMMVKGGNTGGWGNLYSIVSFVNPENGSLFESFFKREKIPGSPLGSWEAFIDSPNEYHYLVGNMNVLFGDGSVSLKNNAWLCNNRQKIADSVD